MRAAAHTLAIGRDGPLARLRRAGLRRPEWWVLAAAAGAWMWMVAVPHPHASHHSAGLTATVRPGWLAVMVVAMMAPLTVSGVRHVALCSLWRRRGRAVAEFVAGYLGVWMAAALLISAAWTLLAAAAGWAAAAGGVVAAALLWELAPARRRYLLGCERTVPLAPGGWRADRDCLRFGGARGLSCVATCWALMAACVAFAHSVPVMVILFAVRLGTPRHQRRPSPSLPALGICLAAVVGLLA